MKHTFALSALALAGAAFAADPQDAPETPDAAADQVRPCDGSVPVFNPEGCPAKPVSAAEADEIICRDRIHEVREANGQARLDKEPEDGEDGVLIAAVDHRVEGCSVMVMRNDTSDIRPIPKASDQVERIPLR